MTVRPARASDATELAALRHALWPEGSVDEHFGEITDIIAGGFLYWHDWHEYPSLGDFVGSRFGLTLTIGAISALIAVFIGMVGTAPTIRRSSRYCAPFPSTNWPPM